MISATPNAETDGLDHVIRQASTEDLEAVGELIEESNRRWGDQASRRMQILVAMYMRQRIERGSP